MRGTKANRAFGTLTALLLCALLLFVGLELLNNASSATSNSRAESIKAQTLDSAHAGLDTALDALDTTATTTSCNGATLQGYAFKCGIVGSFQSTTAQVLANPCTGASIPVAKGLEIIWGKSSTSTGDRTVCVMGLVSAPASGVQMPDNAITANGNVTGGGHMPINADPTDLLNPHDADVYANGFISNFTTIVNGNTYAVGSDSQGGYNGKTHPGSAPVSLPSSSQVAAFSAQIMTQAQNGTQITAAQFLANRTKTYSGDTYINGNVDMTQGTATFSGKAIYINGYLCLSGQASIVNNSGGVIMVASQFAQAGNANGYQVGTNKKGVLAVMGTDVNPKCSASNGAYAASISGNGKTGLGVLWTPWGSTALAGNGQITGMLVAGKNAVFNGGGSSGGFNFDSTLANLVVALPGLAKILIYGEY